MMRRCPPRFVAATVIIAALLIAGCSRYPALLSEWENARPAAYLAEDSQTPLPAAPPPPGQGNRQSADQAVEADPDQAPFPPYPALRQALAPAAAAADFAAGRLADGFTLPELETLVLLRNPALRAAEEEYQAVVERYSQTAAVNDLLSRYAALTGGLATGVGTMAPGTNNAALYPFPGLVALRGDIVRQEVAAARETRAIARRTVLAATRRAFWELYYARQAHAIAIRNYDVVDSLKNTQAAAYAAGTGSFADLVRVDMDHGLMKEAIPIRLEEQRVREAELRALLDLPMSAAIGSPVTAGGQASELPAPAQLAVAALAARQELRGLRAQIAKTELLVAMTEAETHPGYSLNLSAFPGGARPDSFPTGIPAAEGAGAPRNALYGVNEGYLRETRRTLAALRHRLAAEAANASSLIQQAWYQLDKAHRQERLYRDKVVPLARTDLDATSATYEAGAATFAQLLDAYSRWFAATLAWHRAETDVGAAWAGLEESVGAPVGGK